MAMAKPAKVGIVDPRVSSPRSDETAALVLSGSRGVRTPLACEALQDLHLHIPLQLLVMVANRFIIKIVH